MTDDIVARLRQTHRVGCECVGCEAADEIERLRGQIEHHARDRIEYCAAWSKWIEGNDGLEIAQWCRAYADAVPYPNPDGPEIVRVIHSRLDARHRMAADEIERLREQRDEARRRICADAIKHGSVFRRVGNRTVECTTEREVAEMMGWGCYVEG